MVLLLRNTPFGFCVQSIYINCLNPSVTLHVKHKFHVVGPFLVHLLVLGLPGQDRIAGGRQQESGPQMSASAQAQQWALCMPRAPWGSLPAGSSRPACILVFSWFSLLHGFLYEKLNLEKQVSHKTRFGLQCDALRTVQCRVRGLPVLFHRRPVLPPALHVGVCGVSSVDPA